MASLSIGAGKHTAQILGFVPVAILLAHVKNYCGNAHDLMIKEMCLTKQEPEEGGIS